jgi:hypothetical protein
VKLSLRSPDDGDVVRDDTATLKGVSAPGAKIRASGENGSKRTRADRKGRWQFAYRLDLGDNAIRVSAAARNFTGTETFFSVTRKRSAAEIAALRAKHAQEVAARKANFIARAQTIPYNQLEKNPDDYKGTVVKYTGQIFQIQEDYGTSIILMSVTNDGYGFWDDNIWVDFNGEIQGAEDDIITVYGTVKGEKSYETQIGGETYVPQIRAKYIEE